MYDFSNKKVLIFSDTHLTCKFDERQFLALKEIIEQSDKVIINGDFWEYISSSFENFIISEWSKRLFPLLKEKDAIFLHGNHDSKRFMTWEGINKFAISREKDFVFKSGDKTFKVEHGDLIVLEFNINHRKISSFIERFFPTLYLWLTDLEYNNSILGKTFRKFMLSRREIETETFRKFSLDNKDEDVVRVFGHVHMNKHNLDDGFIVVGEFKNGIKNYIFIENGEVKFFSGEY